MTRFKSVIGNCLVVAASIVFFFCGLEVFLRVQSAIQPTAARTAPVVATGTPAYDRNRIADVPQDVIAAASSRYKYMTMPDEWKRVPIEVPGAARADRWQGVVEVYNEDRMRHIGAFPSKKPGVFRVIMVGDSLTYGDGLPEQATFTALLNAWIGKNYKVEFLNLGNDGANSPDVLHDIQKFVPELKPDLVFYGVCLNDFLPSFTAQYSFDYEFPLPQVVKTFFIRNTRFGAFTSDAYDTVLRRFHLRRDFFDDILQDFDGYQRRFSRDVAAMNEVVRAAGLPPVLAMVLDQYPVFEGRGHRIARISEASLSQAGTEVIPTEEYYRQLSGRDLYISRWEGHPNEVANWHARGNSSYKDDIPAFGDPLQFVERCSFC